MNKTTVVFSILFFIIAAVVYFNSAKAGNNVIKTIVDYKCSNIKKNNNMQCFLDGKKIVFVLKKSKDKADDKRRDYIIADILKEFRMSGGVDFEIVQEGQMDYRKCAFTKKSWSFICKKEKLEKIAAL